MTNAKLPPLPEVTCAMLDLIDECPGLTMEQDHWLSNRVRDTDLPSAAIDAAMKGGA